MVALAEQRLSCTPGFVALRQSPPAPINVSNARKVLGARLKVPQALAELTPYVESPVGEGGQPIYCVTYYRKKRPARGGQPTCGEPRVDSASFPPRVIHLHRSRTTSERDVEWVISLRCFSTLPSEVVGDRPPWKSVRLMQRSKHLHITADSVRVQHIDCLPDRPA